MTRNQRRAGVAANVWRTGFLGGALLTWACAVSAAVKTWDGGGVDAVWSTAANWNADTLPLTTDDVVFASGFASGTALSMGADRTVAGFTVDTGTDFTLQSGTNNLVFASMTRTPVSYGAQVLQNKLNLGGQPRALNVGGLGSLTINNVNGGGSLTKTGNGTLIFNVSSGNGYGGFTMNGGFVGVAAGNCLSEGTATKSLTNGVLYGIGATRDVGGLNLAGDVSLGNGGDYGIQFSGGFILTGDRTLTVEKYSSVTGTGLVSGNYSLTKDGSAILWLETANTYTGQTLIRDGQLTIRNIGIAPGVNGPLGNSSTAVLVGDTSGDGSATLWSQGGYTNSRNVTVQAGNTGVSTVGGFEGTSTWSGTLTLNKDATLFADWSTQAFTGNITGSGGARIRVANNGQVQFNGSVSNTYTGVTTVAGTMVLNRPSQTAIPGDLRVGDGVFTAWLTSTPSNQVADTSAVSIDRGSTWYMGNGLTETVASLTLKNGGQFNPSNSTITVTGDVTMAGGSYYGGALVLGGSVVGVASPGSGIFNGGNSASINLGGTTHTFAIANGGAADDVQVMAPVSNGSIIKTGAGKALFTSVSATDFAIKDGTVQFNYSGSLNAGNALQLGNDAAGSTNGVTLVYRANDSAAFAGSRAINVRGESSGPATLSLKGHAYNFNGKIGSATTLNSKDLTIDTEYYQGVNQANKSYFGSTFSYTGTISGTGGIIKTGRGMVALLPSGTQNSFNGAVLIKDGALIFGNPANVANFGNNGLCSASAITIGDSSGRGNATLMASGWFYAPNNVITQNITVAGGGSGVASLTSDWVYDAVNAYGLKLTGSITLGKDLILTGLSDRSFTLQGTIAETAPSKLIRNGFVGMEYRNPANPGFSGGTEILMPTALGANSNMGLRAGLRWEDRSEATGSASFGSGTITLENGGGFEYYANPQSTTSITRTLTNNVRVDGAGGLFGLQTSNGKKPNVAFSGAIDLSGQLTLGMISDSATSDTPLTYSGTVTLGQAGAGSRGLFYRKGSGANNDVTLSGNIVDGAGAAGNPLVLKAMNGPFTISGTGNTYAGGTTVAMGSGAAFVKVAAASVLGTGNVTIQPGAFLQLAAATNVAGGKNVTVQSDARMLGVLSVTGNFLPTVNAASAGVLALDTAGFTGVSSLATLGGGAMYLGTTSSGTFAGASLAAGSGSTYRLGGGGNSVWDAKTNPGSNNLTVSNGVLAGTNDVRIGSPLLHGGGTVTLNAANTFAGRMTVSQNSKLVGKAQAAGSPFGNAANNLDLNGGAVMLDAAASGTTTSLGTVTAVGAPVIQVNSPTVVTTLSLGALSPMGRNMLGIYSSSTNNLENLGVKEKILVSGGTTTDLVNAHIIGLRNDPHPEFLAYDATNGFLKATYSYTANGVNALSSAPATAIAEMTTSQALAASATVRALNMRGNTLSGSGGTRTLTVSSGQFIGFGTVASTATVEFAATPGGTPVEGVIYTKDGFTWQGAISAADGITKAGPGTLDLQGTNTFVGTITVNQGAVKVSSQANTGPTTNAFYLNGGGLLNYNFSIANPIVLGPNGGYTDTGSNWTSTWTGVVSGSGPLTLGGYTGVNSLANTANTFTGNIHVNGALLGIAADGSLGNSANCIWLNAQPRANSNDYFAGLKAMAAGVTVAAGRTITMTGMGATLDSGGQTFTINAPIQGIGGVTIQGSGTVVLGGTNTFSGPIWINSSRLQFSSDANLGDAANTIALQSNGTNSSTAFLQAGANLTTNRTVYVNYLGAFDTNGFNVNFAGTLTGVGEFLKAGNGTLTLSGTNTVKGDISVSGGKLAIASDAALGYASNNVRIGWDQSAQFGSIGTLLVNGTFTSNRDFSISAEGSGNGAIEVSGSNVFTLAGQITSYTGLNKEGTGTLVLTGDSSQSWLVGQSDPGIVINGGTLGINQDGSLGGYQGGSLGNTFKQIKINNNSTLLATETFTLAHGISLAPTAGTGGTIEVASSKTLTIDAVIDGSGKILTKAGQGTLVLAGINTYSGGTVVSAGTLQGTTVNLYNASVLTLTNNGTVAFVQDLDGTYTSAVTGTGSLVKGGSGVVTLSGTNSYGGTTTISGGELAVNNGAAIPDASPVTLANAAGVAFDLSGYNEAVGSLNGGGAAGGTVLLCNGTLTVGGDNGNATFAGTISSEGRPSTSLIKTGTGTQELAGANSYVGGTVLLGGVLRLGQAAALPGASQLFLNGGVLETRGSFYAAQTWNGAGANQRTPGDSANQFLWASGGFAAYGTGPGDDLTVTGGMPAAPTFGSATANRTVIYTGAVANIGTVTVVRGTGSVPEAQFAGPVSGGALTLSGTGVLALSGANSYAGGTIINGGTLLATNTTGSATGSGGVIVNSGGALGGTGSVTGPVTVNSGGRLASGMSPGTLDIVGNLTLAAGSTFAEDLGGTMPGDGTGFYDQTSVSGTADLAGNLNVSFYGSFLNPAYTDQFFILTRGTATAGTFAGLPEGGYFQVAASGYVGQITYLANYAGGQLTGGHDVALFHLIPEPASLLLLAAALAGLGQRRRPGRTG